MQGRELIIQIILQDIKHNQLMNGLNDLGLYDSEKYTLDLVNIVSALILPAGKEPSDEWLDIYHQTILEVNYQMTPKEAISVANKLLDKLSIKW